MIVKELLDKLDYVNQNLEVRSWIYPENGVDAVHKAPINEIEVTDTALIFTGTEHIPKPGVGCHSLLQWIFPTQRSNLGPLHSRQILYHLRYQGSPGDSKYIR